MGGGSAVKDADSWMVITHNREKAIQQWSIHRGAERFDLSVMLPVHSGRKNKKAREIHISLQ